MIACCIPMLVIAVALVAAGMASPAFLAVAAGCAIMTALMMGSMSHGGGDDRPWPSRRPARPPARARDQARTRPASPSHCNRGDPTTA